jgi:hypothetical protein
MQATLTPKQSDDPHDVLVVAPDAVRVAPSDEELSDLLHQAARYRSDTQTNDASDFPAGPMAPPFDTFRPASVNDVLGSGDRRSMAGRAVRAFIALLLAACIGVAAVAWKSYGDVVIKQIAKLTTQVALTSSLPPEKPALVAQPAVPAVRADAANAASPQPAPLAQTAPEAVAPAAAAPSSAESAQLLQSMARDLASVGQEVEQLKASIAQLNASQQQMSRDIARASAQNSRPGISAPPPRSAAARARKPMPPLPPTQAAGASTSPQTAAPYALRQPEPPPQATGQPQADPELSSIPRPPMPVR